MKFESRNPANGEVIATFEETSQEAISDCLSRARATQNTWTAVPVSHRVEKLTELADMLSKRVAEVAEVICTEAGRVKPDAEAELYDVIDAIPYFISQYEKIPTSTPIEINAEVFPDTELRVGHAPHGVIALIMPWNFPFYLPMMTTIAAILTGNSVVIKPSEYSTLVGLKVGELFGDAGFPENLVQIVPGADATGKALVEAKPDKVFFVGSVEAGTDVIARAGVTPVQVELGGNSAAIVLRDADLDLAAAAIAWAGTYHAGQDCAAVKRIFVDRSVSDELIGKMKSILEGLRPGIDYGPYISREARDEVKRRLDDAVARGAKILIGGHVDDDAPGNWMTPSLLVIDDMSTELVAKETFGNVLPVRVVADVTEAVRLANDTPYGLTTSVYSQNIEHGYQLADELMSGMVFINEPFINLPGSDHWTGWRNSGFGTMESKLEQCLRKKVIGANRGGHIRSFWYPY